MLTEASGGSMGCQTQSDARSSTRLRPRPSATPYVNSDVTRSATRILAPFLTLHDRQTLARHVFPGFFHILLFFCFYKFIFGVFLMCVVCQHGGTLSHSGEKSESVSERRERVIYLYIRVTHPEFSLSLSHFPRGSE